MSRAALGISAVCLALVVMAGCRTEPAGAPKPQSAVRIATPGLEIAVPARRGGFTTLTQDKGDIVLPAGTYAPRIVALRLKQGGAEWLMTTGNELGSLKRIELEEGQTTVIEAGPPLLLTADQARSAGRITFGLRIVGKAGEVYSPAVLKGGSAVAPPKIEIVDESGKVLSSGQFEYG